MNLSQYNRVLAFFAHPDDETLAAGATISKLIRYGAEVHVAIPATVLHSRRNAESEKERKNNFKILREDCVKAMSVLGVVSENIYLGEFPDNELDKYSLLELVHWLQAIINRVKPDLLITHHRFCTNIDHQYCHEAAVVATRPSLDERITVLSAEVPSSTGYLKPTQWEPNFYVDISAEELEKKVKAMESYTGESRPDPHPRSGEVLRALAKVRGSEAGCYFAESFMIMRAYG